MNTHAQQILEETRQIISQYRLEVPGGRRAWPESVKARVIQLCELGLPVKQIAVLSGISYFTLSTWIPREKRRCYRRKSETEEKGHFTPVEIRHDRTLATVTVANGAKPPERTIATVTVTLADGVRIDGVTPEFLKSWLGRGEVQP